MFVGLIAYALLGGADFGAGFWDLLAGGPQRGARVRGPGRALDGAGVGGQPRLADLRARRVLDRVPDAFGAVMSTLYVPLFLAAFGIIFRGAAFAFRGHATTIGAARVLGGTFALSSVLTPFFLGAAIGGVASGRVPLGGRRGADLLLAHPTGVLIGRRWRSSPARTSPPSTWPGTRSRRSPRPWRGFRARALVAGAVAGGWRSAGSSSCTGRSALFDGLTSGDGRVCVVLSAGGRRGARPWGWGRYEAARFTAAAAVACITIGWGVAQPPALLPGRLTLTQAAAPHATLVALLVSVAVGLAIIGPCLVALYRMALTGDVGERYQPLGAGLRRSGRPVRDPSAPMSRRALSALVAVCFLAGVVLMIGFDAAVTRVLGVACLFGFVAAGLFRNGAPSCSRAGPPTATVDRRAWRPTPREAREKGKVMPSVVIDRLEPLSSARRVRMSDLARERAADRLGGRTVWCATALPAGRGAAHTLRGCLTADGCVVAEELEITPDEPFRALGGKLDQALRLASALASPTGLGREPGRLGRREHAQYAEGARDGEALAGDRVEPGDVVVLHDALTAALGEALRGRGAHVVWDVPLGTAPAGVAVAATWEFLHPHARAIDAIVMQLDRPRGARVGDRAHRGRDALARAVRDQGGPGLRRGCAAPAQPWMEHRSRRHRRPRPRRVGRRGRATRARPSRRGSASAARQPELARAAGELEEEQVVRVALVDVEQLERLADAVGDGVAVQVQPLAGARHRPAFVEVDVQRRDAGARPARRRARRAAAARS